MREEAPGSTSPSGYETAAVLREQRQAGLRRIRRRVLVSLAVVAASTALVAATLDEPFVRGLLVGGVAASFVALVGHVLFRARLAERHKGAEAERWTSRELRRLDRREWFVIDDVRLAAATIDHVAIGSDRIYAVETRYTVGAVRGRSLASAVELSAKNARRLSRELDAEGIRRTVVPMLVCWGPGTDGMAHEPLFVEGVRVVAGRDAPFWLTAMRRSNPSSDLDVAAYEAIATFVEARDVYAAARPVPAP